MNEEEKDIALIESYLLGELEGEALAAFEARRASDPAFAELLAVEEEVHALVTYQRRKELKAQLQNMDVEIAPKRSLRFRPWMYAAAAVLIAGIFLTLRFAGGPADRDALYRQYYAPYSMDGIDRGPADSAWLARYEAGDYAAVLRHVDSLPQKTQDSAFWQLVKGLSLIERGKEAWADDHLRRCRDMRDPSWSHPAWWYLALLELKYGSEADVIRELKGLLAAPDWGYRKRAAELLDQLE